MFKNSIAFLVACFCQLTVPAKTTGQLITPVGIGSIYLDKGNLKLAYENLKKAILVSEQLNNAGVAAGVIFSR